MRRTVSAVALLLALGVPAIPLADAPAHAKSCSCASRGPRSIDSGSGVDAKSASEGQKTASDAREQGQHEEWVKRIWMGP